MPSFKDIIGRDTELGIIRNALANNRLAHAYIFSGPEGVGKRLLARALAKALNCAAFDNDACNSCDDCAMADAGGHPLVMELWPTDKDGKVTEAGVIRIEDIRALQNAIRYKVQRGKKTIIVEAADRLHPNAANAFLKTLEEPPDDTLIILITARPSALFQTILSRCQRINFAPLPADMIRDWLIEKKGLEYADAEASARLSAGSMRTAVRCAESDEPKRRKELIEGLKSLDRDDSYAILTLAETISKRDDLDDALEFLKSWCRDLLVHGAGAGRLAVNAVAAENKSAASAQDLISSYYMIEETQRHIAPPRYGNKQLFMEALLMGLAGHGALG